MKPILKLIVALVICISISSCTNQNTIHVLENEYLARVVTVNQGKLHTTSINNKKAQKELAPTNKDEFKLRISEGTDTEGTDVELTSKDFSVIEVLQDEANKKAFLLENKEHKLQVEVHYELSEADFYTRKHLKIQPQKEITIERIDVELIAIEDAVQPYQLKQITAQSMNFITTPTGYNPDRPGKVTDYKFGLGQPLYTSQSATFWGVEFPAATNSVENGTLNCGYLWGKTVMAGESYTTYKSVVGMADDYKYIDDAFYKYIDAIRIRPLRLQIQYNSWFDFYQGVTKEKFQESASTIYKKLVTERDCKPINTYVIDDGWQDSFSEESDWGDTLWKINTERFDPKFKSSHELVKQQQGTLGLWYSPGCFFGANNMVKKLGEQGYESLDFSMSMAGPKYMQAFEDRTLELAKQGISYFKFDGVFGHLYTRAFELNGRGTPMMPQLKTEGFSSTDPRLNDSKYDELKTYYLVAGTERLIDIFTKVSEINPEVFMAITNGAYLSPWWLQHVDLVWLINADDGAIGDGRSGELVYRDGVYHDIWVEENTKFPMNAIFNHEPKKVDTGESDEQFREYLFMNLSRGTGFIEFYIKTQELADRDWDVVSEGLKWVYEAFPTFKYVRWHGGNPRKKEVYGYSGWNETRGYLSFHNPSDKDVTYNVVLDRNLGLVNKEDQRFVISSPLPNSEELVGNKIKYGESLTVTLKPNQVKVLDFKSE